MATAHASADTHSGHSAPNSAPGRHSHAGHNTDAFPGGLLVTQDGYSLDLADTVLQPGVIDFRFRILGPDGQPVADYTPIHDKELHLIVARRELTGFWHVHPQRAADGTWSVRLDLPEAGAYRVFTDIAPRGLGRTITLDADLAVAGNYAPLPVPGPDPARTTVVDGYEVELGGDLVAGEGRQLTLTIRKEGAPVTDLQPYLAAFGHWSSCGPEIWPMSTSTPPGNPATVSPLPAPTSPSTPWSPGRASIACSSTSNIAEPCAPQPSHCRPRHPGTITDNSPPLPEAVAARPYR